MKTFKVALGDEVAYSVQFLRSIGMSHSDMAQARGTVKNVTLLGATTLLAQIDWHGFDMPERVNVQNLAKVGPNTRFANCG
jgi:hypothetical protein